MNNYLKSEWYRIIHTKDIYILTGILSGLVLLMNFILMISNINIPNFRYATVSFSFNNIIANMPFLFVCGANIAAILFSSDRKNGIMKNTVANGVSRTNIFISKCILNCTTALCSMVIILIFYIVSACLLLDGPIDIPLKELTTGVGSLLLNAFAATILATALFQAIKRDVLSIIIWCVIMMLIPKIIMVLGYRYEIFKIIAAWLPWNFLGTNVTANMQGYQCLWDTPEGLTKCLVSGVVSMIVYLVIGILINRKKNL